MTESEFLEVLVDTLDARGYGRLTRSERAEVFRIAKGLAYKESAASANLAKHTITVRRKHIFRKLGTDGSLGTLSSLLNVALLMLADRARYTMIAEGSMEQPDRATELTIVQ